MCCVTICCGESSAVQLGPLALTECQRHLQLDLGIATNAAQRDACHLLAESNELGVGTGARREALRADVQRLEQVRLPCAVGANYEHKTRLEIEVEASVRPDVSERDRLDDH